MRDSPDLQGLKGKRKNGRALWALYLLPKLQTEACLTGLIVMAPSPATTLLDANPGSTDGRGSIRIGETSMLTAARQLVLPAVYNLAPTTLILILFIIALILVAFQLIRPSISPIGISRQPRAARRREKTPYTSADEELGLEHKTRNQHPAHLVALPITKEPCPSQQLNMAKNHKEQKKSTPPPSVLQPQARIPTAHSGPSATISLPQGRYTGVLLPASSSLPRAVEAWRGIPYAQSTGGNNRFRPPVPLPVAAAAAAAADVTGATVAAATADTFGQICPGTATARTAAAAIVDGEGEDCLNLNIYRPVAWREECGAGAGTGKMRMMMPVIVYVHGGAFNGGSGTERNMASFVSWAATPVLGVSFNYRVGALGFPSSVVADREGCLNLGLRDQRMLFEWVRSNIGAFGGDPGRVTVMGMSAGAHSVSLASFFLCLFFPRGSRLLSCVRGIYCLIPIHL